VSHILFIHSFVDGQLSCFHLLALWIVICHIKAFLSLSVILSTHLRVDFLDHTIIPCLSFLGSHQTLHSGSIIFHQCTKVAIFLHLPQYLLFFFLCCSLLSSCKVIDHCDFDLYFPNHTDEHQFICESHI
jgi:hypothetical protein